VPEKGGDQEPAANNHEEQEAGYTGGMPQLRDKGIQDREEVKQVSIIAIGFIGEAGCLPKVPSLSVINLTFCTFVTYKTFQATVQP